MRATPFVALVVLAIALGAGCAQSGGSSDGGGASGQGGTGAGTGGSGGRGGSGGYGGAGTGGGGGATATDCSPPCQTDQICVGTGTEGGAIIFPNDAGMCPVGSHVSDPGGSIAVCQRDLSYACGPMPSSCNGTLACDCAGLCPTAGGYSCQVASARELLCVLLAP